MKKGILSGVLLVIMLLAINASSQTPILGSAREQQPSYGEIENFTIVSYSDLEGRTNSWTPDYRAVVFSPEPRQMDGDRPSGAGRSGGDPLYPRQ